jgi:hypothetical protein
MMHDDVFKHVAQDIQQNFRTNKSSQQGFTNIFLHIATTLRTEQAPTILNIQNTCENSNEWPPHSKNFFQGGGNAESALCITFEKARNQDEWAGDSEHIAVFKNDVNALPECRNDHEFGFVALACGVSGLAYLFA